jgi:FPC/CPF motif-containing protein YcgG
MATIRLYDVRAEPATAPAWFGAQRGVLRAIFDDQADPYPCHFAAQGEQLATNYYTYLDISPAGRLADDEVAALADAMRGFLRLPRAEPRHRLSLLCLAGPPGEHTFAAYRERYWQILRRLLRYDTAAWPERVPTDPGDPRWHLCFGGEPLFAFGACPGYLPRRSRVLGDCLVLVFQPLSVFSDMSGGVPLGRAAKRRIRAALGRYENVPLIADTGDGISSTSEKWKQYFPDVDGEPIRGRCPLAAPAKPARR